MSDLDQKKIEIAKFLLDPDKRFVFPDDWEYLRKKLEENNLLYVFDEIEMPLAPVLCDMQKMGIGVDMKLLLKLSGKFSKEKTGVADSIYKILGKNFADVNLNSPKQLSELLFSEPPKGLGILGKREDKTPRRAQGKTKSGVASVDADSLMAIKDSHKVIPLILKYREISKILSTYIKPLVGWGSLDLRVHTTYVQTGAATGRLSSRDPNLQNVPPEVRQVFVASKGFTLVSFDYSQIELRILASVADDKKMLDGFKKDIDIHSLTASQVFNVDIGHVTKEQRHFAKTLNFGVVYGMGAEAFSRSTGLSYDEAEKFIKNYFANFAEVKRFQEKIITKAKQVGYVESATGRKRWLPEIVSSSYRAMREAERAAINMPIQGLAADILKLAMIRVGDLLKRKKLWMNQVKLLLTIHDELLFEVQNDNLLDIVSKIREEMEGVYKLKVPLRVNISSGTSWGTLEPHK